jgi:hypothetical protein
LSYPKQIPGGVLSVTQNNTTNVKGHFFWIPTSGVIGKGPKIFTAQIKDDYCDYYNYQIYSYSFDVGGLIMYLLPDSNISLLLGQPYSLKAICDAANTFDWYIDGNMVQSDTNRTYHFMSQDIGIGDHTVGCKAYDSTNTILKGFEYVKIHVENIWSVGEILKDDIIIYPNPSTGILNSNGFANIKYAELYDINGKKLFDKQIFTNRIDISSLARGLYFIKLISEEGSIVRKFVKE